MFMLNRRSIVLCAVLLLVLAVAQGPVLHAAAPSESLSAQPHVALGGQVLTVDEMDEVSGTATMLELVLAAAVGYVVVNVAEYYGVGTWIQETAMPAIESAVKSAFERLGEAAEHNPYLWQP